MSFLSTNSSSNYSPPLSIKGGVYYCQQTLVPDSGRPNINPNLSYLPNWPQKQCLKYQNARINGRYDLEDNFELGYFNFEYWNGQKTYSTDLTKSGYNPTSATPNLVNFWGNNSTFVGNQATHRYRYESNGTTFRQKNITTSVVLSGTNGGPYPNMEAYTGTLTSGNITIYGRIGLSYPEYNAEDKILGFSTLSGGSGGPGSTGYTLPQQGDTYDSSGFIGSWTSASNITADDGLYAQISSINSYYGYNVTEYIQGYDFGFNLSGYSISGIDILVKIIPGLNTQPFFGIIFSDAGAVGTGPVEDMGSGLWRFRFDGASIAGWTGDSVSNDRFKFIVNFATMFFGDVVQLDYIKVNIEYTSIGSGNSFDLVMRRLNNINYLSWKTSILGEDNYYGLNSDEVESNNFANFLLTYSDTTGYANFYYAKDDEPLTLKSVEYIGDISSVFHGVTNFYEDSYDGASTNNPKIISDYAVSNRLWTQNDVTRFNQHRVNPAYWMTENVISNPPYPSGSDIDFLQFHFPVRSSGTLGSCNSGNYREISYYTPLTSGVSDRFYEFDRSQFNQTALKLDMWVQNEGTHPSGNINAKIEFCDKSNIAGAEYFTMRNFWSGFPISIPSGIHQVQMSGMFYDYQHNVCDFEDVILSRAKNSQLYFGSWYNDIGTEYCGDIRIYSARVLMDAWCTPPSTGNYIPLYTSGDSRTLGYLDLYLQQQTCSSGLDLFIHGSDTTNSGCDLYIAGSFIFTNMPLYIYSRPNDTSSGNIPLSLWATNNSGQSSFTTLFIGDNAPSGVQSAGMNLYINGPGSARLTSDMNLYIKSDAPKQTGEVTLYCCNEYTQSSGYLSLYITTPSGTENTVPISGAMNLFINRIESADGGIPLYMSGPTQLTSNIPMYINGSTPYFSSIPLYINGIGTSNSNTKLYTHGY
jgi:hypothetical protein